MKRGSLCDVIDVHNEKKWCEDTTLKEPTWYLLVWRLKSLILVHCILLCKYIDTVFDMQIIVAEWVGRGQWMTCVVITLKRC